MVAAVTNGENRYYTKQAFSPALAGQMHSLWTATGTPSAGAAAGSVNGAICDDTTVGAHPFVNAVGPAKNYEGYFTCACNVQGTLVLYDRLWHDSGLSATATTNQVIAPPALTRWTSGDAIEIWAEQYGAFGVATAATITLQYTDQGGNTAQAATIPKAATAGVAGTMHGPAALAAGDYGVRAVTGYLWSATQTSGSWGLTLAKRIATVPISSANLFVTLDAFGTGFREIANDACLAMMWLPTATSSHTCLGDLTIAKG
jgi:hypothetical protein